MASHHHLAAFMHILVVGFMFSMIQLGGHAQQQFLIPRDLVLDLLQKVSTVNASSHLCPDSSDFECPDGETCCPVGPHSFGCCPYEEAVCCPDQLHCCPQGSVCDERHSQCLQMKEEYLELSPVGQDSTWPCAAHQTFCESEHSYGCCPEVNAVCCPDGIHCCPEGWSCGNETTSDVDHCSMPMVYQGSEREVMVPMQLSWSSLQEENGLTVTVSNSSQCPDPEYDCEDDSTCCPLSQGEYGCCPMPDAVCCSDGSHCCPHGTECDLESQTCVQIVIETDALKQFIMEQRPAEMGDDEIVCPDKNYKCHTSQTCCPLAVGGYGCCSLSGAVCCEDKKTCCPHGTQCDITRGVCVSERAQKHWYFRLLFPSLDPAPAITMAVKLEAPRMEKTDASLYDCGLDHVDCNDGQTCCPASNTCCRKHDGSMGCCPSLNATCCPDGRTCCYEGMVCVDGDSDRKCVFP